MNEEKRELEQENLEPMSESFEDNPSSEIDSSKKTHCMPVKRIIIAILCVSLIAGAMIGGYFLKEVSGFREKLEVTEIMGNDGTLVSIPYPVTIGGNKISLDEFTHYAKISMMNNPDLAADGKAMRKATIKTIKYSIAINEIAEDYGATLSHKELVEIEKNIQEEKAIVGGEEAYQNALKQLGLTDYLYHKIRATELISQKLSEKLFGKNGKYEKQIASLSEDAKEDFYRDTLTKLTDNKIKNMKVTFAKHYELITANSINVGAPSPMGF